MDTEHNQSWKSEIMLERLKLFSKSLNYTWIFFLFEMILEPFVANVADVALDFAQKGGIFFRDDVVPGTAVEVVDDVVQLQLL